MMIKGRGRLFIVLFILLLLLFSPGQLLSQTSSSITQKSGPMPPPSVEGLDDYKKFIVFAGRYIEEGDYGNALDSLHSAEKIRDNDPLLYELLGIVYDSERMSEKAYGYYKKAGEMYLASGNTDKAWNMLGWMRTVKMDSKEVLDFEKRLKER